MEIRSEAYNKQRNIQVFFVANHAKTVSRPCRYILSIVNSAGTQSLESLDCGMIKMPY
jgi:hypothetical protein